MSWFCIKLLILKKNNTKAQKYLYQINSNKISSINVLHNFLSKKTALYKYMPTSMQHLLFKTKLIKKNNHFILIEFERNVSVSEMSEILFFLNII